MIFLWSLMQAYALATSWAEYLELDPDGFTQTRSSAAEPHDWDLKRRCCIQRLMFRIRLKHLIITPQRKLLSSNINY